MKKIYLLMLALFLTGRVFAISAISGPTSFCNGTCIALTDATVGGTWSVSSTGVATISSSTGVLCGVAPGTTVVTYTVGSSYVTTVVTCNPDPTSISGPTTVCAGSSITLTDFVGGGVWTSSDVVIATAGAGSGVVTGVSTGAAVISYVLSTGCGASYTVSVLPSPSPIGGPTSVCDGNTATLTDSLGGGTWSSSIPSVATVGSTSGVYTGITIGTTVMSYTTGCGTVTTTIFADPLPTVYSITGGGPYCSGGAGDHIELSASDAFTNYSLMDGGTVVSTIVGTGSLLDFGFLTTPGTYTMVASYIGSGCSIAMTGTAVVTIEPLPTITASSSGASCGNIDTLYGWGGATYTWSPTAGLACATCGTTWVSPSATTSYTVIGTDTVGCSSTATVTLAGNRIYGNITFSGTLPDTLDTKVWLIQFNSSDSSIVALDSVTTCTAGTVPYFEFDGQPAGNYMVKAKLIYGDYAGTSGYVPTYSSSTPHWDSAATVAHTSGSDELDINMVYGTVPTGPGFISGYVTSGAGRGTSGDVPAVDMLIYLENTASHVLTYTFTDVTGYYSFGSLANSSYIIYPEDYDYNTIPSSVITLSTTSEVAEAVDFKQHTTTHVISPYIFTTGIAAATSSGNLNMYPNPTSGSLNIEWNDQVSGKADFVITDLIGREVYRSVVDMNATAGQANIELNGLNDGMYIIKIQSASIDYSNKLIIQH